MLSVHQQGCADSVEKDTLATAGGMQSAALARQQKKFLQQMQAALVKPTTAQQ